MSQAYPGYDVLAKWDSPSFDAVTRAVLRRRLGPLPARRFFSPDEWCLLEALVARVLPQPERAAPVPVTPWIDALLHEGLHEGFRYADMPPVAEAWRRGLAALDAEARQRYDQPFARLDADRADALLQAVADGGANPALWAGLDGRRFFIHVLAKSVAAIYYGHPAAWSEIGFGGPASPRGYVRVGFDQRDPWEARAGPWPPK